MVDRYHARCRLRSVAGDERGQVSLAHLLGSLPMVLTLLIGLQLLQIHRAELWVASAGRRAVRSAAVVLSDPEDRYGGTPLHALSAPLEEVTISVQATHPLDAFLRGKLGRQTMPVASDRPLDRLETVRAAAALELVPMSPRLAMSKAGGRDGFVRDDEPLAGAVAYANAAVSAQFVEVSAEGEEFYRERVPSGGRFRIRVGYAFYCSIPIARLLLCSTLLELAREDESGKILRDLDRRGGALRALVEPTVRLRLISHESTGKDLGVPVR